MAERRHGDSGTGQVTSDISGQCSESSLLQATE